MRLLESNRAFRPQNWRGLFHRVNQPRHSIMRSTLIGGALVLLLGCAPSRQSRKPSVEFTQIPRAVTIGGPEDLEHITGRVVDGVPDAQIVVYARSEGIWWVQPFRSQAVTEIESNGSWINVTHLGSDYAALLVKKGYRPPPRVSDLPSPNNEVIAVAVTKGSSNKPATPATLHFSGYDWRLRSGMGDADGLPACDYESSNAWVDEQGYLHLLMGEVAGHYFCAGISLTRTLGYGTYRIVVSDSAHFPLSAMFTMHIRSDRDDPDERSGFSVELSQWGKTSELNAAFVLQPYYIPGNTVRFAVPPGPRTYVVGWHPGHAIFDSFAGASTNPSRKVMNFEFSSGVPIPSTETVKLDFHDFHHLQNGVHHPVEIVVQKFEYLP